MKPLLRKILIVALLIVAVVVTINLKGNKAISQKQQNLEVVDIELPKESTPVSITNEAGLPVSWNWGGQMCSLQDDATGSGRTSPGISGKASG